jgi:Uma2 family endonuclease
LSPNQPQTKVVKNILHCLKHGTQMGWLIDPDEETVFVYQSQKEVEIFDETQQSLLLPAFVVGLNLSVGELFGWLTE